MKSSDFKVIPFKIDHLDLLELRENERATLAISGSVKDSLQFLADEQTGGTIFGDGRAICVLGYYQLWQGLYQVWIIPSKYMRQYRVQVCRFVKDLLDSFVKTHEVHRLQTACLDDELHTRWMTYLGFVSEGVMERYTVDRKNYRMWRRLY